jgi:hypothetical protein
VPPILKFHKFIIRIFRPFGVKNIVLLLIENLYTGKRIQNPIDNTFLFWNHSKFSFFTLKFSLQKISFPNKTEKKQNRSFFFQFSQLNFLFPHSQENSEFLQLNQKQLHQSSVNVGYSNIVHSNNSLQCGVRGTSTLPKEGKPYLHNRGSVFSQLPMQFSLGMCIQKYVIKNLFKYFIKPYLSI